MNKTKWIAILSTAIVVAVIFVVGNTNLSNKESKVSPVQKSTQSVQGTQTDSMADHHGGSVSDASAFNSLVGKLAPDFALETYDGNKIALSSLRGKNVILFFNEGLMCYPACWNQIAAFGTDKELNENAVILNITADPKKDWKQAIGKMPELAKATVLFDSNRQISQAYGVLTLPSSMHKGQFPGHSYVIVDKNGIVKFVQDDVQMAVRNKELFVEINKL